MTEVWVRLLVDDTVKLAHMPFYNLNWVKNSPRHDSSYAMLCGAEFEVSSQFTKEYSGSKTKL